MCGYVKDISLERFQMECSLTQLHVLAGSALVVHANHAVVFLSRFVGVPQQRGQPVVQKRFHSCGTPLPPTRYYDGDFSTTAAVIDGAAQCCLKRGVDGVADRDSVVPVRDVTRVDRNIGRLDVSMSFCHGRR